MALPVATPVLADDKTLYIIIVLNDSSTFTRFYTIV